MGFEKAITVILNALDAECPQRQNVLLSATLSEGEWLAEGWEADPMSSLLGTVPMGATVPWSVPCDRHLVGCLHGGDGALECIPMVGTVAFHSGIQGGWVPRGPASVGCPVCPPCPRILTCPRRPRSPLISWAGVPSTQVRLRRSGQDTMGLVSQCG